MVCPTCGNQIADGAKFCSMCGKSLEGIRQTIEGSQPTESDRRGEIPPELSKDTAVQRTEPAPTVAKSGPEESRRLLGEDGDIMALTSEKAASTNPAVAVILFFLGLGIAWVCAYSSSIMAGVSSLPDAIASKEFSALVFVFFELFPALTALVSVVLLITCFRRLAPPNTNSKAFLSGLLLVSLIVAGARVTNYRDELGLVLMQSAALGNQQAVEDLLSVGAPAYYKLGGQGLAGLGGFETPVTAAVGCGQYEIAQMLIRAGAKDEAPWALRVAANIEIPSASAIGRAVLRCVRPAEEEIEKHKKQFLTAMISKDLPQDVKGDLLARAANDDDVESVRLLFNAGADVNSAGRVHSFDSEFPCLIIAARAGSTEVVKLFLAQGVSSKLLGDAIADSRGEVGSHPEYRPDIVKLLKTTQQTK